MRTTFVIMLGLLGVTGSVGAQGYPAEMVINVPEVEVRAGPTSKYYATGKLKLGDRVWVQGAAKEAGWLAITPPAGSFSWINAKLVRQTDERTGFVEAETGAMLRPGSSVTDVMPDVESVKIPCGSLVTILGKAATSEGNTWLPIHSWLTEVRYIPGEAVQTRQFASNTLGGTGQTPAGAPPGSWAPTPAAGHPAQMAQPSPWVVGQTASFSPSKPAPQTLTYPPRWSQVGILSRADSDKDGRPTYLLKDSKGNLLMYVTCMPGMTLRDYVGRTVALYGSLNYRSDEYMRTYFMTATHFALY